MPNEPLVSVRGAKKLFGSVSVLHNVDVDFYPGEIHGLMGENGAGKSTLCKIISGAILPTEGTVTINGVSHTGFTPQEARSLGISMVYQEFNLIPEMTVFENLFVGKEIRRSGFVNNRLMIQKSRGIFETMGVRIDPLQKLKHLSVAYCQLVEIAKALLENSKLLILDEPTAALTNNEVDILFKVLDKLRSDGISLVYISHRMDEVFRLCDKITVLRDGDHIKTMPAKETNMDDLIRMMIGRELSQEFPRRVTYSGSGAGETVLKVEKLHNERLRDVSFELKKGEILGLAGLVGSGRSEVVRAIFGADNLEAGEVFIKGTKVLIRHPGTAIKNGLALIPEDRKLEGLMLRLSIARNITIAVIRHLSRYMFVVNKREKDLLNKSVNLLSIKFASVGDPVSGLSGGNQQKVVLAKWLASDADIMFFDEPTRGIDVGAKKEIYDFLFKLKTEGKSMIVISSEMEEVLGLCDRIIVMHEGSIAGNLKHEEATQEKILALASGLKGEGNAKTN
ncbi:ribose import ATP-binding protein RbsA [Spirochaetia bacterium]|nr:ribose import ATP-binding protein RbsA [Spirochaetia bacterium]